MKFKFKHLSLSVVLALSLAGCGKQTSETAQTQDTEKQTPAATQSESEKLTAFFAHDFEEGLKDSPMSQSYLGYKWDYSEWDDLSRAAEQENALKRRQRLTESRTFDLDKLSDQEKFSLRIYQMDLERQEANDAFRDQRYIVQQFGAIHTQVPSFLINIHRVADISDAQAYISRLSKVDALFEHVIEQMRIREEVGVFPPKWAYDQMIEASKNIISGAPFEEGTDDSTLWSDITQKIDKLELSDEQNAELKSQAKTALIEHVTPAYEKLIVEFKKQKELSPEGDGVWRLPDGDKWYQNRLQWYTTTDLTADQVHQLGLTHVERIHNEMKAIMEQVGFEGSLSDFFEFMRTDSQFFYPNTDEGRQRYLNEAQDWVAKMKATLPGYFGLFPKADMIVKRVEPFREKSAGKAFYQSPAKDGSRPGIYYANLYDMNSMPIYQMEALAFHEGIPGHHMQRAITQELEGIPEFQKYVSFTAYTEGWGLYTEELAKEMGFYENPYSDFGRLAMELWRACRLVVDTGIHSKKWSREQAIDYLVENTPNPKNDAVKAIERYIALPGQATAYMIGKLKILELREWAKQELGDKFDIRSFHDEVLKDGPVPLNLLEEKIKDWAMDVKKS